MPKVSRSVKRLITGIRERLIETEPNMTDRLLGNIEHDFEFDDREILQAGITIKPGHCVTGAGIHRKVFMVLTWRPYWMLTCGTIS